MFSLSHFIILYGDPTAGLSADQLLSVMVGIAAIVTVVGSAISIFVIMRVRLTVNEAIHKLQKELTETLRDFVTKDQCTLTEGQHEVFIDTWNVFTEKAKRRMSLNSRRLERIERKLDLDPLRIDEENTEFM